MAAMAARQSRQPQQPQQAPHQRLQAPASSGSTVPKAKSTRAVVSQSKKGCLTCKARRVKCDEHKPLCRRCIQAGILCRGYGRDSEILLSLTLPWPLKDGPALGRHADRFSHVTAHVLSLDRDGRPVHEDGVWGRPFLQLSNALPWVRMAAAAFGAAYESLLGGHTPHEYTPALYYYGSALRQLRAALDEGVAGAESLALASLILAGADILSQHEQNAFAHYRGACQILDITQAGSLARACSGILDAVKEELVITDVLIGSHTVSKPPVFEHLQPELTLPLADGAFSHPATAIKVCINSLHRAYRFIGKAGSRRYSFAGGMGSDLAMCQERTDIVAEIRSIWDSVRLLSTRLEEETSTSSSIYAAARDLAELYAIRCQLTSALIFILSIHSPFEATYDAYEALFRNIISAAAAATRLRRRVKSGAFSQFSGRPGVLSPLFIVAMKCRHHSVRRLAIAMLKEQGREGPADGQTLAAIGARIAAIEEVAALTPESGSHRSASDIHEGCRIHGYCVLDPKRTSGSNCILRVEFSMPHPPLLKGWGHVDYSSEGTWSFWSEIIQI